MVITLEIRKLLPELQEKAEKELNEEANRVKDCLIHLRDWLKFQKHLICRNDDQFLLGFLRGCKFSIEVAKKKIDYYYTSRTLAPEFYKDRSPFNTPIQTILNNNIVSLYSQSLTFPKICYVVWSQVEKNNILLHEIIQHDFMALDLLMDEDDAIFINGTIIILDLKDVSLTYLLQCHIPTIKKYFFILQNSYPIRIKGVCVINAHPFVYKMYKLCQIVFTEKMKKRIHIYSTENSKNLFQIVPQHLLPREFGGNAGSVKELAGAWKKKLESYDHWFKEDAKYKSVEESRVGKVKTHSSVFGIEGSFRQLNVD